MKLHARRAGANKWLVIALVVVGLGAGGFWFVRMRSASALASDPSVPRPANFTLYCSGCGSVLVPAADAKKLPVQDGRLQCPKCKKFTGSWMQQPAPGQHTAHG